MDNAFTSCAKQTLSKVVIALLLVPNLVSYNCAASDDSAQISSNANPQMGGLLIGNERRGRYTWPREKAVEFGLNQLAKLVDYVFVATFAMLGLLVKTTIFDRLNVKVSEKLHPLTTWERWTVAIALAALGISFVFGLFAYGMLPRLITDPAFSLDGTVGIMVAGQYMSCALGAVSIAIFCGLRLFAAKSR